MNAILIRARGLLQGEPLRAITYGAIVAVWAATGIAAALGHGTAATFDQSTAAVGGAIVLVTEIARRYVSPAG